MPLKHRRLSLKDMRLTEKDWASIEEPATKYPLELTPDQLVQIRRRRKWEALLSRFVGKGKLVAAFVRKAKQKAERENITQEAAELLLLEQLASTLARRASQKKAMPVGEILATIITLEKGRAEAEKKLRAFIEQRRASGGKPPAKPAELPKPAKGASFYHKVFRRGPKDKH